MADPTALTLTEKQRLFLDAVRGVGTIRKAAEIAHVGRSTVQVWRQENVNGFRGLFEEAQDDFVDGLEAKMFALIDEMKVGHNPTLLIFALKAARPLKYRELTQVPDEAARDLLRKLEEWQKKPEVMAADKPAGLLTALEQVEQILKGKQDGGPSQSA